ncbi:MAG: hypothetical protein KBG29_09780 [Pseudomonadales bacterium]|nr:hypothetical protein [Pseudomonadales bacterium]MBP9034174.1 hypothetical protein [Pseudomonadales bacterium]
MTETTPEHSDPRQGLIDELQSLSVTLGSPGGGAPTYADIPVLQDVVELPRATATATAAAAVQMNAAPAPGADLDAALEFEARSIVDDLMDELLPLVEAQLRERLEERMRQLLAAGPGPAPAQ